MNKEIKTVTCVGAGVIGRGWIHVFTAAGIRTRVYDKDATQIKAAMSWFDGILADDLVDGFVSKDQAEAQRSLVSTHTDLVEAVEDSQWVQENGPEDIDLKRIIFSEIDCCAHPDAIIATSTSSLDINEIASGLPGVNRCILAHPFNPPYVIPAIEVMSTEKADPQVMTHAIDFLKGIGMKPLEMNFFAKGYLFNRLQAPIVRETIKLVQSGMCSVEAVESALCDGLGLRWALFGNFGTNHTNAQNGIREYYHHLGPMYREVLEDQDPTPPSFDSKTIESIAQQVDEMEKNASIKDICKWRDRMVRKIRALKIDDPHPRYRTNQKNLKSKSAQ